MKILHAPNNITNAPKKIADLERRNGFLSDSISTKIREGGGNGGPSHFNSKDNLISKVLFRLKYLYLAIFYYDVLNFHAGASLLPRNLDLPVYKLFGKKVIMHYYGSEVRLMKELKKINPYSSLLEEDEKNHPDLDRYKIQRMQYHNKYVDFAIAPREFSFFVKKIYPKEKVIENIWCGNILEDQDNLLKKGYDYKQNRVPLIVHCPTNKITKGTKYVLKVVENLQFKGIKFKFKLVANLNQEELLKLMANEVDIVLDQFLVGSYANICFEAMSLGKLVFCYVNKELHIHSTDDYPLVNSNLDDLESELERYILDFDLRRKQASLGMDFVKKRLNKRKMIDNLNKLYID